MNARDPQKVREKATVSQLRAMQEVRDCPCCDGSLSRCDIWMHDGYLLEKHAHAGSDGCACSDDGLFSIVTSDPVIVIDRRGKSEGRGCLKDEI